MRLLLSIPLVLIPLTPVLVALMLKNEYAAGAQFIPWVYLISVFDGLTNFMSAGYIVSKKTIGNSVTSLMGAVFSILFTALFLRSIGVYAAIFGSILGYALVWLTRVWHLRESMGVRVNWRWFFFLMGLVGVFIAGNNVLNKMSLWILFPVGAGLFFWFNRALLRTVFYSFFRVKKEEQK
jgi:O-antigen/teichoic acid export membrane protein